MRGCRVPAPRDGNSLPTSFSPELLNSVVQRGDDTTPSWLGPVLLRLGYGRAHIFHMV
jgi:hypothetical protein